MASPRSIAPAAMATPSGKLVVASATINAAAALNNTVSR